VLHPIDFDTDDDPRQYLVLQVSVKAVERSIAELREIVTGLKAVFLGFCTYMALDNSGRSLRSHPSGGGSRRMGGLPESCNLI